MKRALAALLAICLLLSACGGQESLSSEPVRETSSIGKYEQTVYAMDTVMTLTVYAPETAAEGALSEAEKEINRLDDLLSISSESGDIYRLNLDRRTQVSRETAALLRRALEVSEETNGAFDPTVYPLMALWGFTTQQYRVPAQEEIDKILPHVGPSQIMELTEDTAELAQGTAVDLGGIAKGYTSQRVIETLGAAGVDAAIISLGGNVGTFGAKPDGSPWAVAIENPDGGEYLGILFLEGGYFAITSGGYERYFEQDGITYHHILDPATGRPAETDLLSVTIVSTDGTMADALSTSLFVMGFDQAVAFWQAHREAFDMVLVTAEGIFATLPVTSDLPIYKLEASS